MFGTSGIRGPVGEAVTAEMALHLGRALASDGYGHVVVGRDVRESGVHLLDAASAGLRECGASITRIGTASTPTIARSVDWLDADAGLAITASHNPPDDNGFKLWQSSGQAFDSARRASIADRIRAERFSLNSADTLGTESTADHLSERHVRELSAVSGPVEPLDVVVDVGNGTGTVTANALIELGCSVTTLDAQPDGRFPGRPSEPTEANCKRLQSFTAATGADVGIAHDGDADRMAAVTGSGSFVSGDELLALFAREAATAEDRVAVPLNTSLLVEDVLEEMGASVTYTKVGDTYVAERAGEPDVVFGGEPSGAWIWPDDTLCPDGHLAACRLVELISDRGSLDSLVDELETFPLRRESVSVEAKTPTMEHIEQRVSRSYETVDATDGVRVQSTDGWFLIRPSGTEPLIRVTAEARRPARADALFDEARDLVSAAVQATRARSASEI